MAILDTGDGTRAAHRGDERILLCSTHKVLSAAFVLSRVDRRVEALERRIVFTKADLVDYSPVTSINAGEGMTLGALCEAAVTVSDNTAANLLFETFGGPTALTAYLRSLGDGVTRLDRREPALNVADPDQPLDTSTPTAMLETCRRIILGSALSTESRGRLISWLLATTTGAKRLRAGIPRDWRVGDKTGTSATAANDVAVVWPPGRPPLLVTAFYESTAPTPAREAVLAAVGRIVGA